MVSESLTNSPGIAIWVAMFSIISLLFMYGLYWLLGRIEKWEDGK